MDCSTRWLHQVTGRKKGYIVVLETVQAAQGGLGVLFALMLRNVVDSAVTSSERLMEVETLADDGEVRGANEVGRFYDEGLAAIGLRDARFAYGADDGSPVVLDGVSVEVGGASTSPSRGTAAAARARCSSS